MVNPFVVSSPYESMIDCCSDFGFRCIAVAAAASGPSAALNNRRPVNCVCVFGECGFESLASPANIDLNMSGCTSPPPLEEMLMNNVGTERM